MKVLVMFLGLFLITACNDDSSQNNHQIVSTWNLVKFEPGFSPTLSYNDEIQWIFNSNSVEVIMENNFDVPGNLPLNESGTYVYSINDTIITLNNYEYRYEINTDELIIEDMVGQSADGKRLTFIKSY